MAQIDEQRVREIVREEMNKVYKLLDQFLIMCKGRHFMERHSPELFQIALLLASLGYSYKKIAKSIGMSHISIYRLLKEIRNEVRRGELGSLYLGVAEPFISEIRDNQQGRVRRMLQEAIARIESSQA